MTSSSVDHRCNTTRQRTVLLATDRNQSIITEIVDGKHTSIAYATYGEQSAQQPVATALGFNGQMRESSIGVYILGNGYRAYNPTLMRFNSPDSWSPFGQGGLNAYMYCVGDPVNRVDPTGHVPGFLRPRGRGLGNAFDFFFGGADAAGPKRTFTDTQMALKKSLEGKGEGRGLASVSTAIAVNAPINKAGGLYPATDIPSQGVSGGEPPRPGQGTPWQVSSGAQGSHSFATHSQVVSSTGRPNEPGPPPSYAVATTRSGMRLWSVDTFAASQQPQTYLVYMAEAHPRPNYFPAPHPVVHQGNFGTNVAALRAAAQNRARGRANLADAQQVLRGGH